MRLDLFREFDWQEFRRQFPEAYGHLLHMSLIREREFLRNTRDKAYLNAWEKERLAELDKWYASINGGTEP